MEQVLDRLRAEQVMADKAEYARKGIARGKPIVALEYQSGVVLMAENRSASLRKIHEIYDRIAFGGVGKLDEYENLRKAGVRYADMRGYSFSREDVAGKSLANEYSTVLGAIFTREAKALGHQPDIGHHIAQMIGVNESNFKIPPALIAKINFKDRPKVGKGILEFLLPPVNKKG